VLINLLIVLAAACVFAIAASVVMAWASRRSTLWNMAFGGVLALAALIGALIIAWLLARAAFPA
jgi:hypothetical protein